MSVHPLFCVASFGALALPLFAVPASADLTLVPADSTNNRISVGITAIFSASDTTDLSGSVSTTFEIDPETDQVSEMTFVMGDFTMMPITLKSAFSIIDLKGTSLEGTLSTPIPPGTVTPATGSFDSSQHYFEINKGTISGTAAGSEVAVDFATDPVGQAGVDPGTVSLIPLSSTPTNKTYQVTVEMPIAINETMPVETSPGTFLDVTITAAGLIKASGTVIVETASPYEAWAIDNGIPGALFGNDENSDGVPNGILWALGLSAADSPLSALPVMSGPATSTVTLPPGGSAGELLVESSTSLEPLSWSPLAGNAISGGLNPIPPGTSGTVTIVLPSGDPVRGLRLRALEP